MKKQLLIILGLFALTTMMHGASRVRISDTAPIYYYPPNEDPAKLRLHLLTEENKGNPFHAHSATKVAALKDFEQYLSEAGPSYIDIILVQQLINLANGLVPQATDDHRTLLTKKLVGGIFSANTKNDLALAVKKATTIADQLDKEYFRQLKQGTDLRDKDNQRKATDFIMSLYVADTFDKLENSLKQERYQQ